MALGGDDKITISTKRQDLPQEDEKSVQIIEYQLINVTSVVNKHNDAGKGNIVSAIRVQQAYHELRELQTNDEAADRWYLFNHFSVSPVSEEEAIHIDLDWKIPATLMYERVDVLEKPANLQVETAITSRVFDEDLSLSDRAKRHRGSITFTPLSQDEMPKAGDVIAIDAEFVTLNQEETEIRSDGTKTTLRPSQRCVARISCIRASNDEPFIDDYIATQEQVSAFI